MSSISATALTFEEMWAELRHGLSKVFGHVPMNPREYMNYYSKVYKFCTQSPSADDDASDIQGNAVYVNVKDYLNSQAVGIIERGKEKNGEDLLSWYSNQWTEYQFCSKVVDGLFSYLNRQFLQKMVNEQDELKYFFVQTLVLQTWRENLFGILGHRITDAVLDHIRMERLGETINKNLLKAILISYVDMGITDEPTPNANAPIVDCKLERPEERRLAVYRQDFQEMFIKATKKFYEEEAVEFLANNSVVEYMKRVEKRIQEEEDRINFYLHASTKTILIRSVEEVMITRRVPLFQAQFGPLLEQMAKEDLGRMYSLCSRVDQGLQHLRKALEEHIVKEGTIAMEKMEPTADKEPKSYIDALLDIHERYSVLIKEAFKNEHGFIQSLDKAAAVFVNRNAVTMKNNKHNANKTSELLAKTCDSLLRKNSRMLDETELEANLEKVVIIFKYVEDKDIFSKIHTRFLSRRLINETSASEEGEVSLITKLKSMCGFEYTTRMTKMIGDIRTSADLSASYKEDIAKQSTDEILPDFSTMVLSTGSWPALPSVSLCLPTKMARCVDTYTNYYTEKHSGRKLTWVFSQSRGEIAANCFPTKKIFTASCAQITVLMLYNTATSFSFGEIVDASGMDKKNASLTVAALVKGELLKGDDLTTTEYDADDMFDLNLGYKNKKVKVDLTKIAIRSVEAKKDEDKELNRSVEEDRRSVIQACIVRIMKMRKTINHQQLMLEVLEQLSTRFKPRVDSVKKCIGTLMEKDYMKRSEESRDVYEYVA